MEIDLEPRTFHMLGKGSAPELQVSSLMFLIVQSADLFFSAIYVNA